MKRILIIFLGIIIILVLGIALLIHINADKIGLALSEAVLKATGRPLVLASPPRLSLFPKIGLSLGEAAWGREKDGLHVTIQGGTVRLALFPLFSGRIDIEEIYLDTPYLFVEEPGQAVPATSSEASDTSQAPQEKSPDAPKKAFSLPVFSLNKLEIKNATILFKNKDGLLQFRKLEAKVSNLAPGSLASLEAQGEFLQGKNTAENDEKALRLDFAAKSSLVLRPTTIRLDKSKIDIALAGKKEHLVLQSSGPLDYALASGALSLGGMDATYATADGAPSLAKLDAAYTLPNKAPLDKDDVGREAAKDGKALFSLHLAGTVETRLKTAELSVQASGSPKALLESCGLSVQCREAKALNSLGLITRLKAEPTQIQLSELKARLDETSLSGEATITLQASSQNAPQNAPGPAGASGGPSPLQVKAQLALSEINVDQYLPPSKKKTEGPAAPSGTASSTASSGTAPSGPAPSATASSGTASSGAASAAAAKAPHWPGLAIRLTANKLVVAGLHVDKLDATLSGSGGTYALRPCTFTLYEGRGSASAELELGASPQRYALDMKTDNVRLGGLLADLAKLDGINGRISLVTSLSAHGPEPSAASDREKSDALLRSLNGSGKLDGQDLSIKSGLIPADASEKLRTNVNQKEGFRFSSLSGNYTVSKGRIALQNLTLTGNNISASAAGNIDLPGDSLDLKGAVLLARLSIPVTLSGSLRKPVYRLDASRLLFNTVEGVLKGGKDGKTSAKEAGKALKNLLGL